jgi:uroporphyrin-III C-methyltransferase/precorrin-2 dehydrogenase/sirohydrochlorin ferrochelatase
MDYLPIFLDLRGSHCLVVGGGAAAARKATMLERAGARVSIVACRLGPDLRGAVRRGAAIHLAEFFAPAQLDGVALVIVADETLAVNEAVSRAARARAIPVNVMDEPALCSFIMPAIVDRSPVVVAVATGGSAPVLARLLCEWLDHVLPARFGALAAFAGRFRALVKRRLPDLIVRRRFWEEIFAGDVAAQVLEGEEARAGAALLSAIDRTKGKPTRDSVAA